jgi:hypothetical protein
MISIENIGQDIAQEHTVATLFEIHSSFYIYRKGNATQ